MIAVVDYGVGNVFSVLSALKFIGAGAVLTGNADEIAKADKIILPGVGAFGNASQALRKTGLDQTVINLAQNGKPLLGICLGMQLLFDSSEEYGEHKGLGLIPGKVISLTGSLGSNRPERVPHISWEPLTIAQASPLLKYTADGDFVYYVHSFYVPKGNDTAAYSLYGNVEISGLVQRGNVFGTQFHPEKSSEVGLKILRAFTELNK